MDEGLFSSDTLFTPPTTEEDRLAWLRLIRSRRVGPATFLRLIAEHGTAQAGLAALPETARIAGMEGYEPCPVGVAVNEIAAGRRLGARLICRGMADYPQSLLDIADAPPLFWALGNTALLRRPMVALVGARNASSLGVRMAKKLGAGLTEAGFAVVSGLARGIDAAAHEAALAGGTIAVQAGGVDVIYPAENADLAARIAQQGLRISEQPIGLEPQARHFPMRNRIISGLAQAVVVVEAAARSGSLITARNELDQGRDVLAVPGHPFDARASGCNQLLRDGATLVRSVADVLEALGHAVVSSPDRAGADAGSDRPGVPQDVPGQGTPHYGATRQTAGHPQPAVHSAPVSPEQRSLRSTASLHSRILARLGPSALAEDQLIRDLALPAAHVAPELLHLELEGKITRQAGGLLSRVN